MVVTPYYPISDDVMKRIIRLKLGKIIRRVRENHGIPLTYDDPMVDEVASRCREVQSGARNVDNILTNTLLPEMSRELLPAWPPANKRRPSTPASGRTAISFMSSRIDSRGT